LSIATNHTSGPENRENVEFITIGCGQSLMLGHRVVYDENGNAASAGRALSLQIYIN
jgi:hypothetical protein